MGEIKGDSAGCRNEPCKKFGGEEREPWNPTETLAYI